MTAPRRAGSFLWRFLALFPMGFAVGVAAGIVQTLFRMSEFTTGYWVGWACAALAWWALGALREGDR